jgi:hypothetical protein
MEHVMVMVVGDDVDADVSTQGEGERERDWVTAHTPLVAAGPSAACTVCVVIPARDEAAWLDRTLTALAIQVDLAGAPLPRSTYEILVLANNCRDKTAAVARRVAARYTDLALHVVEMTLPPSEAHVGRARKLAMDEACRRLLRNGKLRGVIASTDADTSVAPTWIAATLQAVHDGADAVGGRILIAPDERAAMQDHVRRRFLRNVGYYALAAEVEARLHPSPADPWPHHTQFFGASMAVTAQAYRQVGGVPALLSNEDVELAAALTRADFAIRHSPAVQVWTSARLLGRTPSGLSALLSEWSSAGSGTRPQMVPPLSAVIARATRRRLLRADWEQAQAGYSVHSETVAGLAERYAVPAIWLAAAISTRRPFGALLQEVEARSPGRETGALVDIGQAIMALRVWLAGHRRTVETAMYAQPATGAWHERQQAGSGVGRRAASGSLAVTRAALKEVHPIRVLAPS